MSTPRPQVEDHCAVCGWPLAENRDDGCRPGDCSMRPFPDHIFDPERANREYGGRHKFAEGVAAPLEPITAEEFFAEWGNKSLDRGHRDWPIKFAEAYAAAVSKNLQWKLGNEILIKNEWRDLCKRNEENCFKALDRIRELEKEIAVLRETK
jgi:hypothetical protein